MNIIKYSLCNIIRAIWNGRNRFSIIILAIPSIWLTIYFIYNSYYTPYFEAVGGWVIVFYGAFFGIVVVPIYIIIFLLECWLKRIRIPHIISDRFFWALLYGFILINLLPTLIILMLFILAYLRIL